MFYDLENADSQAVIDFASIQDLVAQTLLKLRVMQQRKLPAARQRQIESLIESAQTHTVFLDELARTAKTRPHSEVESLVSSIRDHCRHIDKAYEEIVQ